VGIVVIVVLSFQIASPSLGRGGPLAALVQAEMGVKGKRSVACRTAVLPTRKGNGGPKPAVDTVVVALAYQSS